MENIFRLGQRTLRELGETNVATNSFFAPPFLYQAINSGKDEVLAEILKTHERYRALVGPSDVPLDLNVPADNNRVAALPSTVVNIIAVQVLMQNGLEYQTIEEQKLAEGRAGDLWPSPARGLGPHTTYSLLGESIFIDPPSPAAVNAGLRVWAERDVPELLVGQVVAFSASTITLATTTNDAIGQEPGVPEDDIYNGLFIEIVAGSAAVGQRVRITDYTGSTRQCAITPNWGPVPSVGDTYALVLPFPRVMSRIVRYWAAMELLSNAGEDPSGPEGRYERAMESWIEVLDARTPGQRVVEPFDLEADL